MADLIIAEDEADLRGMYKEWASIIFPEFRIVSVEKAEEMLAVARDISDSLIFVDKDTKSLITGIEAMRQLRLYEAQIRRNPAYAVLITGDRKDIRDIRKEAFDAGINETHKKPIDPSSLFLSIRDRYVERGLYLQANHL